MWNTQYFVVQHDNLKHGTRQFINDGQPVDASVVYGPYNDKEAAKSKAQGLARQNAGWSFVVCETIGAYQADVPDVSYFPPVKEAV